MKIVTVGLDIAKQTFQAHGVDCKGKVVLRKRLRRVECLHSLLKSSLVRLDWKPAAEPTTGFGY